MHRLIRNILRLPARTLAGLRLRRNPAFELRRAADAGVAATLTKARVKELYSVPGNTADWQCRLLFHLAHTSPNNGCIVEIGAYKGRSTAWLAEAARLTGKRMHSIDPHLKDSLAEFQRTVERFRITEVAQLHRSYSHDVGVTWKQPISMLWIDGGHKYEIIRDDIRDFCPHLVPGGYVVFDDVNPVQFPGVVQAIGELVKTDATFEDLGVLKTVGVFRRRG